MLDIALSTELLQALPGSHVGFLEVSGVDNTRRPTKLDDEKRSIEQRLRQRYAGFVRRDFLALPVMAAYDRFYNRFDKTSHVLLQLESVVFKGRGLPHMPGLVSSMFMVELKNQLLTAGHDADAVREPVTLGIAAGDEAYTLLNGQAQTLKAGDMYMRDAEGVISSIIYGPDGRTRIAERTCNPFYVVYAPPGIPTPALEKHFDDLLGYIRLFAPEANEAQRVIFEA